MHLVISYMHIGNKGHKPSLIASECNRRKALRVHTKWLEDEVDT